MRRDWSGGAQRALDSMPPSIARSRPPINPVPCRRGRWSREGIEPLPFAFLQTRRSPTELQPPARSADYGHQLTLRQARAVA